MDPKAQFLQQVLSVAGYNVLAKAADRVPSLWKIMVPRAVVGYLAQATGEVKVPVLGGSLVKSESGWSGNVGRHEVAGASIAQVAAIITLLLGHDPKDLSVTNNQAQRLGKTVDALIATQLAKAMGGGHTEPPGQTHAPTAQQGPMEPTQPIAKQPPMKRKMTPGTTPTTKGELKPKLPRKSRSIKVELSKAEQDCPSCGLARFKGNKFSGCLCWRELAKSIKTTAYSDGYVLDLGKLDDEQALSLLQELE